MNVQGQVNVLDQASMKSSVSSFTNAMQSGQSILGMKLQSVAFSQIQSNGNETILSQSNS